MPQESEVRQAVNEGRDLGEDVRGARGKPVVSQALVEAVGGDPAERKPKEEAAANPSLWSRIKGWFARLLTIGRIGAGGTGKVGVLGKLGVALNEGAKLAGSVTAIVSFFFQGVSAGLDIRAAISSRQKYKNLDAVAKEAKEQGADPKLVEAVKYAMNQKYKKYLMRTSTAVSNLIGVGVTATLLGIGGLGMLASNPVGWAISGVLAVVGISFAIYKIWRYFKKGSDRGKQRNEMAGRLFMNAMQGDAKSKGAAQSALKALGLPIQRWLAGWSGMKRLERDAFQAQSIAEIMRKLKTNG
jgi:hypothetical protein